MEEKQLIGNARLGDSWERVWCSTIVPVFEARSHGFVAARSPLWGYRANRVPLSHANSPATAVIASRRGLTSNTSWLVFLSTVGVSPLLLAPPPPPFFHQSLVLHLGSSLFNSFPSSLFLLADPPSPASVSTSVCLTVSFPFLPSLSPLRPSSRRLLPPCLWKIEEREREREVERLVRSRSARTHTLSLGPKINSSCSLHFLPDVKQPFVRSCQASQERPRGVPTPWTATNGISIGDSCDRRLIINIREREWCNI